MLTITASNEKLREELASSVGLSVLVAAQPARLSVQSCLKAEQEMVSKLKGMNCKLRKELHESEDQFEWQRGTTAGANSRPCDLKSAAPRRLVFETAKAEEGAHRALRHPHAEAPPRQTQGLPPGTPHRGEGVSPSQSVTDASTNAAKSKEADRVRIKSGLNRLDFAYGG